MSYTFPKLFTGARVMIESVNQRPTPFQYALATPNPAPRADQEAVATELNAGLAVTATESGSESDTATDKGYGSDSRINAAEQTEKRLVRERGYDEEIREYTYTIKQEPGGEVIFEIPTEAARKISSFIDQLISLQEQEKLPEEQTAVAAGSADESPAATEASPEAQDKTSVEAAERIKAQTEAAPQQTDPVRTAVQAAA